MSKCCKIHGYSPNFKNNSWKWEENVPRKVNAVTNDNGTQGDQMVDANLTQEQYNALLSMLSKYVPDEHKEPAASNTAHLAGMICLHSQFCNDWIINSEASNYIWFNLNLFDEYKLLKGKPHYVTVPDERKVRVQYIGTVVLQNSLKLHDVLFVPNFRFNLISVNKHIKDLKCKVWFILINVLCKNL